MKKVENIDGMFLIWKVHVYLENGKVEIELMENMLYYCDTVLINVRSIQQNE